MGALPKERVSHARKGERRSHMALGAPQLRSCPRCHKPRLAHHMCPFCGTYQGRLILEPRGRKKKPTP